MTGAAKTAERLVRRYLHAQGGENSGFVYDAAERDLAEAIQQELVAADRRARRDERRLIRRSR